MPTPHRVDRILLSIIIILVVVGFFVFSSASLGLLAREGARFSSVAFNQGLFGIIGGTAALLITSQIYYRNWRQYAFYIFLASIILTLLVFIDGISFSAGGASRWIKIGNFTMQPSEFLKIGFVIYMATWLSGTYKSIGSFTQGFLPFVGLVALVGAIVLAQPDTDTFLLLSLAATAMFVTIGGKWRHVLLLGIGVVLLILILAMTRPYIKDRLTTFINPSIDPTGQSYQIQQSLIAIGSGGLTGRGYGQSVQKFDYLPEPIGDSIFAVFAEEFGFIGSIILISILSIFTFRGFKIATHATDMFGMLLVVGFMTLIVSQAFLNIAAMTGMAPLMGLPLPFMSHGGTALLALLTSLGIVLNVSKYQKRIT